MKLIKTKMLNFYMIKLIIRLLIFISSLAFYIYDKELMWKAATSDVFKGIHPLHIVWFVFMFLMFVHIFPHDLMSMAIKKTKPEKFKPKENYDRLELLEFIKEQNSKAWMVMLLWLSFNAIFGILYIYRIITEPDLLMLTISFFLCDYICILFFCPFQSFIMGNCCCVNCRIYDWGHFMMFTPMLMIKNFFSWSLFFMSVIVLIKWEIIYNKYPERFWRGSNETLQCSNCKDRTCQIKRKITKKIMGREY